MSLREELLDQLTSPQREVVQQLHHGPVKVTAAAGSGKTRTMAALYAIAVLDGVPPARILAVTFTERGAAELRQRVAATLAAQPPDGGDALEGAWIGTFHQLALRLLAERAYEAQLSPDLHLLDEVEAALVLEAESADLRGRLGGASRSQIPAGADPRDLTAVVGAVEAAVRKLRSTPMAAVECRRRSAEAYRKLADPTPELDWHRFALDLTVELWERYETALRRRGAVDFDGLLRTALGALRSSESLRRFARNNFRLLIVDEFQDTSPIQASLLNELSEPRRQGVFVVGDARQSIFAFRDAQPTVMAETKARSFSLDRNHRSLEPILRAADHVIRADPNFATDREMEVARNLVQGNPVLLGVTADPEAEAEGIASLLEQLRRAGVVHRDGGRREVEYGDMAVLARTFGRLGPPLEEALRRRNIPFQAATGGLLERPEVKDALALLATVAEPIADRAWVRLLQSPFIRVSDAQLGLLLDGSEFSGEAIEDRISSRLSDPSVPLPEGQRERVTNLLETAREARAEARVRPATWVLDLLLERSGLLRYHDASSRAGLPGGERALAALRELNRVAMAAQSRSGFLSAGELLRRLRLVDKGAGRQEPAPQDALGRVTLSTVHRAKGLEWPVVVLADCRPHHPRAHPRVLWDRTEQAVLVTKVGGRDTAAYARWKLGEDARVEAEEHRRLVYVAMTRAEDLLVVTTSRTGVKAGGPTLAGQVEAIRGGDTGKGEFAELLQALARDDSWLAPLPGFPNEVRLPWAVRPAPVPAATEGGSPEVMNGRGDILADAEVQVAAHSGARPPRQLSFSGLSSLERCPRQFWLRHLAQFQTGGEASGVDGPELSSPRERAMVAGREVHRALERCHGRNPERAPTAGELAKELTGVANPADRADMVGWLTAYASSEAAALPTLGVEIPFRWRRWGNPEFPPLTGAIDRVARLPTSGEVLVLDYKTNRALSDAQHDEYSRQLCLYSEVVGRGLLGRPLRSRAALILLRTGERIEVDTSEGRRREALDWARELAGRAVHPEGLSALGMTNLPCGTCPYAWFCPERDGRPQDAAGHRPDLRTGSD